MSRQLTLISVFLSICAIPVFRTEHFGFRNKVCRARQSSCGLLKPQMHQGTLYGILKELMKLFLLLLLLLLILFLFSETGILCGALAVLELAQ